MLQETITQQNTWNAWNYKRFSVCMFDCFYKRKLRLPLTQDNQCQETPTTHENCGSHGFKAVLSNE